METLIQMVVPSVVLPLLLSALLWWFAHHNRTVLWSLPLIWLPSYLWLIGWPSLFPAEANQWLWLLVVAAVLINLILKSHLVSIAVSQTVLLALVLVAVAWPVLQYQFGLKLIVELLVVIAIGLMTYTFATKGEAKTPALSLAISSGGMGLVVALGGSLLIGQLAGALASVLVVFAGSELIRKLQPSMSITTIVPVMQLYLVIVVIARIYAEIPLVPSVLLLIAPLVGLIPARRYAFVFSAASVMAALSWLLLTADSSAYY